MTDKHTIVDSEQRRLELDELERLRAENAELRAERSNLELIAFALWNPDHVCRPNGDCRLRGKPYCPDKMADDVLRQMMDRKRGDDERGS